MSSELRWKLARWQQSPRQQQQWLHGKHLPRETIPEGDTVQLLKGEATEKRNCLKFDIFENAKYRDKTFGFCSSST